MKSSNSACSSFESFGHLVILIPCFRFDDASETLSDIKGLGPFDYWLRRDSNASEQASELAKISGRIDFIQLELHVVSTFFLLAPWSC